MIQRLREKRQNEEGFTLVELLVVIGILGILASIVVFAVGGIMDKGETSAAKTEVSILQTAEEAYYANANTSKYATEAVLVSGKFLRTESTSKDICVKTNDPATADIDESKPSDYKVVAQGTAAAPTDCGDGWSTGG